MRDPRTPPSMATEQRVAAAIRRSAPGAPNVVVIVLDDLGFAHLGCYGSDLVTPNIDRLAARGLRFTNFHTTAVCSPTRACLLTGRNHHRVGMGMLPDMPTNFPAYSGRMPQSARRRSRRSCASDGYATFCVGKWHLVPRDERVTGPYDMWPTGLGFDRYYGFLNGETNQWTPNLVRDTNHVEPPRDTRRRATTSTPTSPTTRSPTSTSCASRIPTGRSCSGTRRPRRTRRTRRRRSGSNGSAVSFDDGWDAWRARDARAPDRARHRARGHASCRNARRGSRRGRRLDDDRRRLYARMMEVFAAFVAHADHHIGRVLDHLEATGELDNTDRRVRLRQRHVGRGRPARHLQPTRPLHLRRARRHRRRARAHRRPRRLPLERALPVGLGARRQHAVPALEALHVRRRRARSVHPRRARASTTPAAIRDQYCHAIDVLPTVLELCGVALPDEVDGIAQMSVRRRRASRRCSTTPTRPRCTPASTTSAGAAARCTPTAGRPSPNHVNQLTAAERDADHRQPRLRDRRRGRCSTPAPIRPSRTTSPRRSRSGCADLVDRWFDAAERNEVFPLDDGAVQPHRAHARPVDRVAPEHPLASRATRCTRSPGRTSRAGSAWSRRSPNRSRRPTPACCASRATGSRAGRGTSPTASCAGASRASTARARSRGRCRRARRVLVADGAIVDGQLEVALRGRRRRDRRGAHLGVPIPLAWAPDGAFLTVGYGRPFPVTDELRAARARAGVTGRRHDHDRTAPAVRPRRRARARPAPPVNDESVVSMAANSASRSLSFTTCRSACTIGTALSRLRTSNSSRASTSALVNGRDRAFGQALLTQPTRRMHRQRHQDITKVLDENLALRRAVQAVDHDGFGPIHVLANRGERQQSHRAHAVVAPKFLAHDALVLGALEPAPVHFVDDDAAEVDAVIAA